MGMLTWPKSHKPWQEPRCDSVLEILIEQVKALTERVSALELENSFLKGENRVLKEENRVLREENRTLKQDNKHLTEQILNLKLKSDKSSKPPGSDGLGKPPTPKNLREKTGKKAGGQPGHRGVTLEQVDNPTYVINHPLNACPCGCGCDLSGVPIDRHMRRQVFDLPPLELEVTQHQVEVKTCPVTGKTVSATWPTNVKAPVQYGPKLLAWIVSLSVDQMVPFNRIGQICFDTWGLYVSDATIQSALEEAARLVEPILEEIGEMLLDEPVLHADETGVRVAGKLHWLLNLSTGLLTLQHVHEKRGSEAMVDMGILPLYTHLLCHDCFSSYFQFSCLHALCCAHLLRELKYVQEDLSQKWAGSLADLLLDAKMMRTMLTKEDNVVPQEDIDEVHKRYRRLVGCGLAANPKTPAEPGRRGRAKQSKARNLTERLKKYEKEILFYLTGIHVPFTNNQAERDFRMAKVKLKVSGCFRTFEGARLFAAIRSYTSTARKHGINSFKALAAAFSGDPFSPREYRATAVTTQ